MIGHIPIDVNELNVDLLSASAHKFNGPKGIGFLYVREGTPILPLLNGGAQENSLRAGTENVASNGNCIKYELFSDTKISKPFCKDG